jgi:hypothetical protein
LSFLETFLNAIFITSGFLFLSVQLQFIGTALKPGVADNVMTAARSV